MRLGSFLACSALCAALSVLLASCDHCEDCGCDVVYCVATCGSSDVVEACGVCPEGLLPDVPISCVEQCGGDVVWEGCGWECPEGLVRDAPPEYCIEKCGGPWISTVCEDDLCPAGTFPDSFCGSGCDADVHVCVFSCDDPVTALATCGSCADEDPSLSDWSACPGG